MLGKKKKNPHIRDKRAPQSGLLISDSFVFGFKIKYPNPDSLTLHLQLSESPTGPNRPQSECQSEEGKTGSLYIYRKHCHVKEQEIYSDAPAIVRNAEISSCF